MLASLVGVISVWSKLGTLIEKNLHYLVSFSAGVFILIAYELGYEAGWSLWILVGAIASLLIFKLIPDFHHHHDSEHSDHNHSPIDARRVIISDSIHNIGDGILLVAAFSVSTTLGITTALSVFIHELIQEISEFFVLKQAGLSTKKALLVNFFASSTILIGAIGGYFLLEKVEAIEVPLFGITAGAFLVVVLHDLIPHSISSIRSKKHVSQHVFWFILGAIIISIASAIIPHLH
jgi:zinc and cadmium transporter